MTSPYHCTFRHEHWIVVYQRSRQEDEVFEQWMSASALPGSEDPRVKCRKRRAWEARHGQGKGKCNKLISKCQY